MAHRMISPSHGTLLVASLALGCSDPAAEAREALEIDDLSRAQSVLTVAIEKDPRDAELRSLLFDTYERQGDWDSASEVGRVVVRLDSIPSNVFKLMYAEAQLGALNEVEQRLESWPLDAVRALLQTELRDRGVVFEVDSTASFSEAMQEAEEVDSVGLHAAASALGIAYYLAARLIVSIGSMEPDDFLTARFAPRRLAEIRTLNADVSEALANTFEDLLATLVEPTPLGIPGTEAVWLFELEGYHVAVGALQAALGDSDEAMSAYRRGETAIELVAQMVPSISPIGASHQERIALLIALGETTRASDACADLARRFPDAYRQSPPDGC